MDGGIIADFDKYVPFILLNYTVNLFELFKITTSLGGYEQVRYSDYYHNNYYNDILGYNKSKVECSI